MEKEVWVISLNFMKEKLIHLSSVNNIMQTVTNSISRHLFLAPHKRTFFLCDETEILTSIPICANAKSPKSQKLHIFKKLTFASQNMPQLPILILKQARDAQRYSSCSSLACHPIICSIYQSKSSGKIDDFVRQVILVI